MLDLVLHTQKEPAVITLTQSQLALVSRAVNYYVNEVDLGLSFGMDTPHREELSKIQLLLKRASDVY